MHIGYIFQYVFYFILLKSNYYYLNITFYIEQYRLKKVYLLFDP